MNIVNFNNVLDDNNRVQIMYVYYSSGVMGLGAGYTIGTSRNSINLYQILDENLYGAQLNLDEMIVDNEYEEDIREVECSWIDKRKAITFEAYNNEYLITLLGMNEEYNNALSEEEILSSALFYSIYLEKVEDGYDVYVDTSDERIDLQNAGNHEKYSHYLTTINKGDSIVLPFEELVENEVEVYYSNMEIMYHENDTITLILNDTFEQSFISSVEIDGNADDEDIIRIYDDQIEYGIDRKAYTLEEIEGNTEIIASHRLLAKVVYVDAWNKEFIVYQSAYVEEDGSVFINRFHLEENPVRVYLAQILEEDNQMKSISTWSKEIEWHETNELESDE